MTALSTKLLLLLEFLMQCKLTLSLKHAHTKLHFMHAAFRDQLDFLSIPMPSGDTLKLLGSIKFSDRVFWPWIDNDLLICQLCLGGEINRGQLIVLDWRLAIQGNNYFRFTSMQVPSSPNVSNIVNHSTLQRDA